MVLRGALWCGVPGVPGVSGMWESGLVGVKALVAPHQKKGSAWDGKTGQPPLKSPRRLFVKSSTGPKKCGGVHAASHCSG